MPLSDLLDARLCKSSAVERMIPRGLRISWAMLATTRPMLTSLSVLCNSFSSCMFFCMRRLRTRSALWMMIMSRMNIMMEDMRHIITMAA